MTSVRVTACLCTAASVLARDRRLSKRLPLPSGLSWAATTASTARLVSTASTRAAPAVGVIALPRQQPSRRARRTTGSPRLSGSHAARGRRHPPRYCFLDGIGRTPQANSDRPASADRAIGSRGNQRPHHSDSVGPWHDCFHHSGVVVPAAAPARISCAKDDFHQCREGRHAGRPRVVEIVRSGSGSSFAESLRTEHAQLTAWGQLRTVERQTPRSAHCRDAGRPASCRWRRSGSPARRPLEE